MELYVRVVGPTGDQMHYITDAENLMGETKHRQEYVPLDISEYESLESYVDYLEDKGIYTDVYTNGWIYATPEVDYDGPYDDGDPGDAMGYDNELPPGVI